MEDDSANSPSATPKNGIHTVTLPVEVWERIASYTDSTIISLCHAIPSLKHISEALYNVGASFDMRIDYLWPDMYLPVEFRTASSLSIKTLPQKPLDSLHTSEEEEGENFQDNPPATVQTLIKLVSRHGGTVKVMAHSIAYFEYYQPILPKTISVYIPAATDEDFFEHFLGEEDSFGDVLETIRQNHEIRCLVLPFEAEDGTDCLSDPLVLEAAKNAEKLECHNIRSFPLSLLATEFPKLKEVVFTADHGGMPLYRDVFDALCMHKTLKRVVFEEMFSVEKNDILAGARMSGDGWTWFDGIGNVYQHPCVVWEKVK
ncbi:UNVERIFIED_CONTAM: hypothetical protein HDU68_005534 [Siphonaria sp. JEL0065]|nr:hypothetical protein HDU68_005534 [Siphonaria sp. JEL0065]